jgi:phage-related protein
VQCLAANETTTKFKVDISELKKGIQDANRQIRLANAEFKAASAGMEDWAESADGLTAKINATDKVLKSQKTILESYKKQLELIVKQYGESSKEADEMRIKIANQQAAVSRTEKELGGYNQKLSEMQHGEEQAALSTDKLDKSLDDVSKKTKNTSSGFSVLKGALANLVSDGIEVAVNGLKKLGGAIINAGKQSLASYADYEQLVGGVETLFKDSAKEVQKYAANAFKTTGLSANDYMETVTSFSASLLQSLDGDTKKAAESADKAMRDMSDNANKMGTSMESIMNAYQGFAKGQFNMLDNLKLGYGGTKDEMKRLLADAQAISGIKYNLESYSDIIDAINVIQTKMGITGTTAKEAASTISGSIAMTKAAFQNLMTGLADDTADIGSLVQNVVDGVTTAAGNVLPRIKTIMSGIGQLMQPIGDIASELLVELTGYIPDFVSTGVSMISAITKGIVQNAPSLSKSMLGAGKMLFNGLTSITSDLAEFGVTMLSSLAEGLVQNLPKLAQAATEIITRFKDFLVKNIPLIINAAVMIIGALVTGLLDPSVLSSLLDAALQIALTIAKALIDNIPQIIQAFSSLVENIASFLESAVPMILDAAIELFMAIVDALPIIIDLLAKELPHIIDVLVKLVPKIIQAITKALPKIVDAVTKAIPMINDALIKAMPQIIKSLVDILIQSTPVIMEAAVQMLMGIVQAVMSILQTLDQVFRDTMKLVGEWISNIFTEAVNAVSQWFSQMISDAKQAASDLVNGFMQFMDELPYKIGHALGEAIAKIINFAKESSEKAKSAAKQFIINTVLFFATLPARVGEWLNNTISKVTEWATNLANKGKEGAADLVRKIETEIFVLPQKMFDAGKNLVEGLWNGITAMGDWLQKKITGFANGIIDGFKETFDINSPSKIMRDQVGKYIAQGVGVGIAENMPQVGKDALRAVTSSLSGAKEWLQNTTSGIGSSFSGSAESAGRGATYNTFNQYNTSPKALSRLEIYRQSKNLLSMKGA